VPLPAARVRSQATDTAEAHRFYGPSYDQAQLMGVPDLFFSGYFGSGVKLAIFDTGLKLGNVAVEGLRVQSQHDFISGDNFCSFTDSVAAIDKLRFLGLVKDPVVAAAQDRTLLCFVADSFAYAYNPPRRAIWFSAYSTQGWLDPAPIALSQQATPLSSHTFENLELATGPAATYLVYNDLKSNYRARPAAQGQSERNVEQVGKLTWNI